MDAAIAIATAAVAVARVAKVTATVVVVAISQVVVVIAWSVLNMLIEPEAGVKPQVCICWGYGVDTHSCYTHDVYLLSMVTSVTS